MTDSSLADAVGPLTRRPGTSIELAEALLALFTSGEYSPGDRLPSERQLVDQLGVGRSAMREALKALTVLGIIEVRQGDGTYLRRTTSDLLPHMVEWGVILGDRSLDSLAEARQHIEVSLAGLAAQRRTSGEMERIQSAFDTMRVAADSGDLTSYADGDLDFHLAIAAGAHSQVLAGILRNIGGLLLVWTVRVLQTRVSLAESLAVHAPILAAIEAGDADAGQEAMDVHMREAVRHFHELSG